MKQAKKLIIRIEKGPELYEAWAENAQGIYGEGKNVKEAKKNILESIRLYKEINEEKNIPEILNNENEIEWEFDIQSFLQYYNGILSKSALEKITGINQKLLGHYASGLKKPRKVQIEKMDKALREFISEMQTIHII